MEKTKKNLEVRLAKLNDAEWEIIIFSRHLDYFGTVLKLD